MMLTFLRIFCYGLMMILLVNISIKWLSFCNRCISIFESFTFFHITFYDHYFLIVNLFFDSFINMRDLEYLLAKYKVASYTDIQLSPTIDGRDLQLLLNKQTNEPELIGSDILVNLQASSDPAKLVLDIIQNHIALHNKKGDKGVILDVNHIFLLEQLMRISPHVEPHVREEALKLALDLKADMRALLENSLAVLGFLLFLSIYGLASSFNEDEVLKLFEFAAEHKQAVELFQTMGFVDKISGMFIENCHVLATSIFISFTTLEPSYLFLSHSKCRLHNMVFKCVNILRYFSEFHYHSYMLNDVVITIHDE